LRKRVLSYVKPSGEPPGKTRLMLRKARTLETILTETENEAFILEDTLIKRYMPRYNVILRDDKRYPCLRLDLRHAYPRLQVVRRIRKDGALYYGPFSSAGSVRATLKLIETVLPLRKCRGSRPPKRSRPCLNYQLRRCLGPCTQDVPPELYAELVAQVRLFLEGRNRELLGRLRAAMKEAAGALEFEKAARIRDRIRAMERIVERQHVVSGAMEDWDVIGLAQRNDVFQLVNLHIRRGALAESLSFRFRNRGGSASEVMEAFVKQHYAEGPLIPRVILLSHAVEDVEAIQSWLSDRAAGKISLHRPLRGEKRRLVSMAEKNAESLLERQPAEEMDMMEQVRKALRMHRRPERIEGMDISNVHGNLAVGTVAAFREGEPDRRGYRNYRIKAVERIDDYAMMAEMTERRLNKGDPPDLLLVDGGKGHLAAVERVVNGLDTPDRPAVAAIAKRDEKLGERADKVFIPGRKNPLSLAPDHPVLLLLMRIRDETHRRAVGYHRRLRGRSMTASFLDAVPGIGPKRKQALLNRFRDVEGLSKASPEEIAELPGISMETARRVSKALKTREYCRVNSG
ncbi:MAG: excinuclease ABC subunit UvrC, partial [Deltaproteobacteria bacterium]|nr:excinuclease ABC subunit UvrC [Deltaproteobacteria bacterium]